MSIAVSEPESLPVIEADDSALVAMEAAERELEETYSRALDESRTAYVLVRAD